MDIQSVGSVCSGIEAASVAWGPLGFNFEWFSENAEFPSKVLEHRYPNIPNLGDANNIPMMLRDGEIGLPDMICAGTPCQAFSLAGWKNGLNDDRGNLTMKFIEIVESNDFERNREGLGKSIIFWENVEGVLTDKTNAFGCLISSLAGLDTTIEKKRWPNAGVLRGPKRNIAWRVLDAKFFGVPQQRKRVYLLAGGKDFYPENILFEIHGGNLSTYPESALTFERNGHKYEIFREYTDCLYAAYGTKWNGNAAAYNGSLFVVQDKRIRRLTPLECERLMGFPDDYTRIDKARRTNRYQAIGNSWAVPVVRWIGERLREYEEDILCLLKYEENLLSRINRINDDVIYFDFGKDIVKINDDISLNCTVTPEICNFVEMRDIICDQVEEKLYISPVGCQGIVRRKQERNLSMNPRLEEILLDIAGTMSPEDIERRSRVQKRGRFSATVEEDRYTQLNLDI